MTRDVIARGMVLTLIMLQSAIIPPDRSAAAEKEAGNGQPVMRMPDSAGNRSAASRGFIDEVIHPRDTEGEALIDQLKRIGCNVRGVWPPPATIPQDIDTVFQFVDGSEESIFPTTSHEHAPEPGTMLLLGLGLGALGLSSRRRLQRNA